MRIKPYVLIASLVGLLLVGGISNIHASAWARETLVDLTVSPTIVGHSTAYIGACEGNVRFDLADFRDLGINTYRLYGGMSRWEYRDDDGRYGWPTVAAIKANPNVVNWAWWDRVMTRPIGGSDYHWAGFPPEESWQGNARTLFQQLQQAGIRPVLTLRNTDANWDPDWASALNPPRTRADWYEWWEHVFATVYWLNVRNDYRVDDFEIHNEPDNLDQGWGGTQADYLNLVRVAADAIAHVYTTYLPDRTYTIHAPNTLTDSTWVTDAWAKIPGLMDIVNIHNYADDISPYVRQVRQWIGGVESGSPPIWMGEWGTYEEGYADLGFSLNVLKNLMRAATPGDTYVYGSHLFSLYDWGLDAGFDGLIDAAGHRRTSYYALRMGIRALQGQRPVLQTNLSPAPLLSMATQDPSGTLYLLIVNDQVQDYQIHTDLHGVLEQGEGSVWELSKHTSDAVVRTLAVDGGEVDFALPAQTAFLIQFPQPEDAGL